MEMIHSQRVKTDRQRIMAEARRSRNSKRTNAKGGSYAKETNKSLAEASTAVAPTVETVKNKVSMGQVMMKIHAAEIQKSSDIDVDEQRQDHDSGWRSMSRMTDRRAIGKNKLLNGYAMRKNHEVEIKKLSVTEIQAQRKDYVLECKGRSMIKMTEEQAILVQELLSLEGKQVKLHKHMQRKDLNKDIALRLIELITIGYIVVPENFRDFINAANKLNFSIKLDHPISGENIVYDTTLVQVIANAWKQRKHKFTFGLIQPGTQKKPLLDVETWRKLLHQSIVFVELSKKLIIEVDRTADRYRNPDVYRDFSVADAAVLKKFCVGCTAPLYVAAYHTCTLLHSAAKSVESKNILEMGECKIKKLHAVKNSLSLRIDCYLGACMVLEQTCNRLNMKLTCKEKAEHEAITLSGGAVQVEKALSEAKYLIIPSGKNVCCFMSILSPDIQLLGRLIYACQKINNNEANMIFNIESNEYLTCQTYENARAVLKHLANLNGEVATTGPLTMVGTNEEMAKNLPKLTVI